MYGYNFGMAGSMVPNGYGNMPAPASYRPAAALNVQGRIVASIDEVRAAQVALDGSVSYFPSPGEGKIYVKGIDMQGLPYIQTYDLQKVPAPPMDIEARLLAIENKIKEMECNGKSQPAAANTNAG